MQELYQRDLDACPPPLVLMGVDEAGRGALAGPVVVAAVCLDYRTAPEGLNDSKLLSPKQRARLFPLIISSALSYVIVEVDHSYIDKYNILQATLHGFTMAYRKVKQRPDVCLIDGNRIPDSLKGKAQPVIKGDQLHACIAAASILAKVHRDTLMEKYDLLYPEYGFAVHKGYGTEQHRRMISSFGFCPIHRKSFHCH